MRTRFIAAALALAASSLAAGSAHADEPKFVYGKQDDTKGKVIWKAAVNAGLVLNTGNANSVAFTAGGMASMLDGKNKLQLDVIGTYARATAISGVDANMNGAIDPGEVQHTTTTSAALWNVKLRYDRFLTANNSLYATGFVGGNEPAGIRLAGGAQVGYSRQIVKTDMHLVVAEIGYDYTYQNNVTGPDLNIHSARVFAGYTLTLNANVGVLLGLEVLCNLNSLPGYTPGTTVDPFGNTRVNGAAALNAKIWKNIAFQVSFLARYTTDPALLPAFKIPFAAGFFPRAESLDTVTSLSLVVTLL
ncbi:MAG TPA: DUF481 domain-containing protein [Polyangia bacterium]